MKYFLDTIRIPTIQNEPLGLVTTFSTDGALFTAQITDETREEIPKRQFATREEARAWIMAHYQKN